MIEKTIQKVSIVGQVIEDLSFEPLSQSQFEVQLTGFKKEPIYKQDCYFVFSDLPPNDYSLQITGKRFQKLIKHSIIVPKDDSALDDLIIDSAGDNELIVIVKEVMHNEKKVTFINNVVLNKEIRAGSRVISTDNFLAKLATDLGIGEKGSAILDSTTGLTVGSIIRIIRDKSIRLKFDPYYIFRFKITRVAGKVLSSSKPDIYLEGAKIRLTKVNEIDVHLKEVGNAKIALVDLGGKKLILGAENDILTTTNQKGDYNLYFDKMKFVVNGNDLLEKISIEVTLDGYQSVSNTEVIATGQKKIINFQLTKI